MYEVFDQGTYREALIKGMEEKLKGSYRFAWKLKGHYFAIELADICPFNFKKNNNQTNNYNYEERNVEIDSADIGVDTDGTGDYARSDELHVGKCKKENRTEQGARSYFLLRP